MSIKPVQVEKPEQWQAHTKKQWMDFILEGKPLGGARCWKCNALLGSPNGQCPAQYNHERKNSKR